MAAAVIISSIAVVGLVASFITVFDKEGPEMFKIKDKDDKEE